MEKKTNNPAITKSYAKKMETISPFELKNKLIDMADESIKKIAHTMLNAGRGNPNWIATEPREAFFLLGQFGLCECRHAFSLEEGTVQPKPSIMGMKALPDKPSLLIIPSMT